MDEEFLEEYAESLAWDKVLSFQDYSTSFEKKFKYNSVFGKEGIRTHDTNFVC